MDFFQTHEGKTVIGFLIAIAILGIMFLRQNYKEKKAKQKETSTS